MKAITEYGRIQIPAAEVERILASAGRYEGMPKKPAKTKAELQSMKPEIQTAWKAFLKQKREGGKAAKRPKAVSLPRTVAGRPDVRAAALGRLARARGNQKAKS